MFRMISSIFLIALPAAEAFCKVKELFIGLCIALFQKFFQHILLQEFQLSFLRDAEARVDPNHMEMIPDDRETEAVDRGDLGAVDQSRLPLQPYIPRPF